MTETGVMEEMVPMVGMEAMEEMAVLVPMVMAVIVVMGGKGAKAVQMVGTMEHRAWEPQILINSQLMTKAFRQKKSNQRNEPG